MEAPLAIVLDDDTDFNWLLKRILSNKGFEVKSFAQPIQFLSNIQKLRKPDICFIDLNITQMGDGLSVIEILRSTLKMEGPIFVVSSVSNTQAIRDALEKGATDFLVKPIDRHVLMNKLSHYIESHTLLSRPGPLIPEECISDHVNLKLDLEIIQVDETGVTLTGGHLFAREIVLALKGPILEEITGTTVPQLLTLTKTEFDPSIRKFKYYAIFDPTNASLLTSVRKWILRRARGTRKLDMEKT